MTVLRDFLEISYDQLEEMNLEVKEARYQRFSNDKAREQRFRYLSDEKRIKAVTVCFTDLEGRLHMLDYDKKFLLRSADSLTFDGSSVRGFSIQSESDLRLDIDWSAFYWLPSDVFGPGKVLIFAEILDREGRPYGADMRSSLRRYADALYKKDGISIHAAHEIEGFLFRNFNAERHYHETNKFEFISTGGYYHSLPNDSLRHFIDAAAEAQRAMGFTNEKDHPEVAPSQFEMNFSYTEAVIAADQVLLYKLLCRQVAHKMGLTASFLPKPVTGVNGNGMHTNLSLNRGKQNLFYDGDGPDGISAMAWEFIERILNNANDICLALNSSVNSYRRLDPHYEAPNQIKASAANRGSMVRIPWGNERSARVEIRSVAPDANPYLTLYTIIRTGLEGPTSADSNEAKRSRTKFLPSNIYDAIRPFKASSWTAELYGENTRNKYVDLKQASAERCPKELGTMIKSCEIQFHHEVTNQYLWSLY